MRVPWRVNISSSLDLKILDDLETSIVHSAMKWNNLEQIILKISKNSYALCLIFISSTVVGLISSFQVVDLMLIQLSSFLFPISRNLCAISYSKILHDIKLDCYSRRLYFWCYFCKNLKNCTFPMLCLLTGLGLRCKT